MTKSNMKSLNNKLVGEERNYNFYNKRLQETVTDGKIYIPELLLAILKELEIIRDNL